MLVFDSHLDLAWNALQLNRDLTAGIQEIRHAERNSPDPHLGSGTVCFPEMRKGRVGLCLATILARSTDTGEAYLDYRTPEVASAMGHGQRTFYKIMEQKGHLKQLTNWDEMDAHVREWQADADGPIGYVLSMEGADPILNADDAERWWELGLRVVGLSHYGHGVYADGTAADDGLNPRGFELLRKFEALGMIVDVTHLTDKGFREVMDTYNGPLLASHHNCRSLVPGQRQLDDEQIKALVARNSVIGAALDSWMLWPSYEFGITDNSVVKLDHVTDHIDRVCQIAGNTLHAAIGSDLDGGYGREQSPSDLDTIADLQKIPAQLERRGYRQSDIENIMHGNWLRFFRNAWTNDFVQRETATVSSNASRP